MYEPDVNQYDAETHSPARTFFGICLIMLGVGVAAWLVVTLVGLIAAGSMPGLVAAIVPDAGNPVTLEVPGGEITLPREVFTPIGYLLVFIIYMMIGGLAKTLINSGTSLLQPDLGKILRRLVERLEQK